MKTIYLILIFFSNCTASCIGKIAQDIKKSVATTKKSQSQ